MTFLIALMMLALVLGLRSVVVLQRRRRAARDGTTWAAESNGQPMRQPFVPYGVFLSSTHTWAAFSADGTLRVGLDSVLTEALGPVDGMQLPPTGAHVERGDPLVTLRVGSRELTVPSPMAGEVMAVNLGAVRIPDTVVADPYGLGWLVRLRPLDHKAAIEPLYLGNGALAYLKREHQRLVELLGLTSAASHNLATPPQAVVLQRGAVAALPAPEFATFEAEFLRDSRSTVSKA